VVNWSQSDVEAQFQAGNAAMMVNGPWRLPLLNAAKGLGFGAVSIGARGRRLVGLSARR
jgi:multiple sugar transport system substrate-binding protein